jgi:hypothetical protein
MRATLVSALVLAGCGGVTVGTMHDTTASHETTLDDVAWIVGSWETAPDEHGCTFHETWRRDSDMLLTGHAHETCPSTSAETQPFDEDLRIEAETAGLVYVAWPTGQSRTEFPFSSGGAHGFVAENPDHDFPTRIEYRHTEAGGIDAIVSGPGRSFTLSMHPAAASTD